jgi:serine/threonine protein kinase
VVTLWYRAPELLIANQKDHSSYTSAVDLFGIGCIFGELWKRKPLIQGKNEVAQLTKIIETIGTPTESEWPEFHNSNLVKANKKELGSLSNQFSSAKWV